MSSHDRRAAARRRAWGRGPAILRFEPLEGRQLMTTSSVAAGQVALPDLVTTAFHTVANADWNDTIEVSGSIANLGQAPVPAGALAGVYASASTVIGPGSELIGVVTIKSGLLPGETQNFDQQITLPPSPLGNANMTQLWLGVRLDPGGVIAESNKLNNEGRGLGIDQSIVTITPKKPSNLIGTSFAVTPNSVFWGQSLTVTAQIANNAQGDAPATRAKIVLTPTGQLPGGAGDVTIGSLQLPAVPAFQRVNIAQQVTLPALPPTSLFGGGSYLISMIQDADHQASTAVFQPQIEGLGLDTAVLTVSPAPGATAIQGPKPDLAATGVVVPSAPIYWGQSIQVDTTVQNVGLGNAPDFKVEFLLTGVNGSTDHSIYLGSADVPGGLAASYSQDVIQTVKLPSRLPYGYSVAPVDYGRIVAIIDPENQLDETSKTNNVGVSAPVTLYLLGTDGKTFVPTLPPVRAYAPLTATVTPTTPLPSQYTVVPRKQGAYRAPRHKVVHQNAVIHQFNNYTNQVSKFFKRLSFSGKSR